jgi:hypothetical protein
MKSNNKNSMSEIKLKPRGKLFKSKPQWSLAIASPFLALIAIYSSGHGIFFLLSAVIAGLFIFLLITAWLWFGHTVTIGNNYVKIRNSWRVYTFIPDTQLTALRVRSTSPVLFLKQAKQKAMINTLRDEQIELVIERLNVTPDEATIGANGMIDQEALSKANRDILPFWIKNPVIIGLVVGIMIIILVVIAGVIAYAAL